MACLLESLSTKQRWAGHSGLSCADNAAAARRANLEKSLASLQAENVLLKGNADNLEKAFVAGRSARYANLCDADSALLALICPQACHTARHGRF